MKPLFVSIGLYIAACALPARILPTKHFLNHTLSQWGGYWSINGFTALVAGLLFGWLKRELHGVREFAVVVQLDLC